MNMNMNKVEKDGMVRYELYLNEEQLQLIRKLLIESELNYRDSIEREILISKMQLHNH